MKYTFVSTNIYQSKPLLSAFWNKFTKIYIREISPDLTKAELFVPRHAFYLHRAWRSVQCKTWCGRQKTQNKNTHHPADFSPTHRADSSH